MVPILPVFMMGLRFGESKPGGSIHTRGPGTKGEKPYRLALGKCRFPPGKHFQRAGFPDTAGAVRRYS